MENKNMPTMFIDTVYTNINSDNFQTVYDSRYKENAAKWKTEKLPSIIEKKINGILSLINKGNKINLYFDLGNSQVEGFIKQKEEDVLFIESNSKTKEININDIKDIIILD
jgi:hypothetical protein